MYVIRQPFRTPGRLGLMTLFPDSPLVGGGTGSGLPSGNDALIYSDGRTAAGGFDSYDLNGALLAQIQLSQSLNVGASSQQTQQTSQQSGASSLALATGVSTSTLGIALAALAFAALLWAGGRR